MFTVPKPFHQRSSAQSGFTLIELLVALSIFLLLTGIAAVNYRTFNQRQELQQSARNIQEALRFAQKKARVGEKPAGCATPAYVEGYSVRATATGNTFQIYAECRNGASEIDVPATDVEALIGRVRFDMGSNFAVVYKVLTGGTDNPVTIRLINNTVIYQFTVNRGGEISEGNFVSN